MKLLVGLLLIVSCFGQSRARSLLVSLEDAPNAPIDSNSGGGCTGSSGAWTCTGTASVTIADATAQFIYYTTDGSTPACPATGTLYTGAISVSVTTTLKAIGCNGVTGGGVLTSVYTISAGGTPVFASTCSGSGNSQNTQCVWTVRPSSGYAVAGVVWFATAGSVTSVHDGTGTDGSTGSSTYVIETQYNNGTNFASVTYYTLNYVGTNITNLTVNLDSARSYYVAGVTISAQTGFDGYNKAQSSSGTAALSGTVTTTNATDLLVGLFSNACGLTSYTSGTDGQGNTFTQRIQDNQVVMVQTLHETATNTYSSAATQNPTCAWNAELMAFK